MKYGPPPWRSLGLATKIGERRKLAISLSRKSWGKWIGLGPACLLVVVVAGKCLFLLSPAVSTNRAASRQQICLFLGRADGRREKEERKVPQAAPLSSSPFFAVPPSPTMPVTLLFPPFILLPRLLRPRGEMGPEDMNSPPKKSIKSHRGFLPFQTHISKKSFWRVFRQKKGRDRQTVFFFLRVC